MSDVQIAGVSDVDELIGPSLSNSLRGRMRQRARQRAAESTRIFEVPGWEDMLAVELRVLSHDASTKILQRNAEVVKQSTRLLYNAADHILAATVAFYEVDEETGEHKEIPQHNWISLAREGLEQNLPANLTPRQALIALIEDHRVVPFATQWEAWALSGSSTFAQEIPQDFGSTP